MAATSAATILCVSSAGLAGAAPPDPAADFANAARPSISADGRVIVFEATSSAGTQSVYSLDINTRAVTELSTQPDGRRPGDTTHPQISDDGCVVVVTTEVAYDLFRDDDTGDRWDVYRLVMPHCGNVPGEWELVSTNRDGTATDRVAAGSRVAVSGSGTMIAYTEQHPDPSNLTSLQVVDLTVPVTDDHRTTSLPIPSSDPAAALGGARGAAEPSISNDGSIVAFSADYDAASDIPEWFPVDSLKTTVQRQVFVWSRPTASTSLVSAIGGLPAAAGAQRPIVSGDGRYVFFESDEQSWIPTEGRCDARCGTQVFRADLTQIMTADDADQADPGATVSSEVGAPQLVSGRSLTPGSPPNQAGNRASYIVDVNDNGNQVAFATASTNLGEWGLLDPQHHRPLSNDALRTFIADVNAAGERSSGQETLRQVVSPRSANTGPENPGPTAPSDVIASSVRLTADGNTAVFASRVPVSGSLTVNTGSVVGTFVTAPTVVMPALDFGTITTGAESGELFTTVQNLGPGSFAPTAVRSESATFKISGGTCTTAVVVAMGDSCSVRVTFTPTEETEYSGQISVSDAAGRSVTAALAGIGGRPALRLDPGGLDLGVVAVGETAAPSEIQVVNIGFEAVVVDEVGLADSNTNEFSVVSDECTGNKLGPRQSCSIAVAFSPVAAGLRSASVRAITTDGSRSAAVVGGWGTFRPTVTVSKTAVRPNDIVEVTGVGFPATETVTVVISGALDAPVQVVTGPDGTFGASVTVNAEALPGPTVITVRSPNRTFASTALEIEALPPSVTFVPHYGVA